MTNRSLTAQTDRPALDHDSFARGRLGRECDVLVVNGHSRGGGDNASDVEYDCPWPRGHGQRVSESSRLSTIRQGCHFDDLSTSATSSIPTGTRQYSS